MDETTVEWVCATYPERIAGLFKQLDLDREGLQTVRAEVEKNDPVAACKALLAYYRAGTSGQWLRWAELPAPGDARDEQADAMLNDTFTFHSQTDRVPRRSDGGLDWEHRPENDREWHHYFVRQYHLQHLLNVYRETGHRPYAERIDEHPRDWIGWSWQGNNIGDNGLDFGNRPKSWVPVFYALQQDDGLLSPAARLLMLISLPEHARFLRDNPGSVNWITMTMSGLGMIAAAWPEFKESDAWMDCASSRLSRELNAQVYPDGVQFELTSGYHLYALGGFTRFAEICRDAGFPLPKTYQTRLEAMWNYLATVMLPCGHGRLNGDSSLTNYRDRVLAAAKTYNRPDWAYIASNGEEGERPEYGPSVMFPWAGQFIVRSGWEADALLAYFELSRTHGGWHGHHDKLHLSLTAFGRDLLVDSGKIVKGQENPHLQGWYSPRYNEWEPNPTATLTAEVPGTTAFAWVLQTAPGMPGKIEGDILENTEEALALRIRRPGAKNLDIRIPWKDDPPTLTGHDFRLDLSEHVDVT